MQPNIPKTKRILAKTSDAAQFYSSYGIAKSTYYAWRKKYPEFRALTDRGIKNLNTKKAWQPPYDQIRNLAARGLNKSQIAAMLSVKYSLYMDHQRTDPKITEAFESGQELGVAQIKGKLFEKASMGDNWAIGKFLDRHDHATEEKPEKIEVEVTYVEKAAANKTLEAGDEDDEI